MTERRAGVRLDLTNAGFTSKMADARRTAQDFIRSIDDIGGAAEKTSRKTSGFFAAVKAGAGGARGALGELGGTLKNTLVMAATLGGSISIAGAAREAVQVTSSYKDLAFAIRRGTGEAMSWQQVQADVQAVSGKWKRGNKEIQQSFAGIFQETGNLAFTKAAIDSVGQAANATGKSTQLWSNIAGTLGEKFGIGASGIQDAMATVVDLTNHGGISAEDLSEKLGLAGASAKFLGIQGQGGLAKILAMLNMADDSLGNTKQKFGAVTNVLDQMADPGRLKEIEKALGVKLTDSSGGARGDAIERIIGKTKGKESELRKAFGQNEVKLVASLAKPFVEAFEAAEGDVKTKTAAAIEAYRTAIEAAGKSEFTGADLRKEATDRLTDSERNMQEAMNKFIATFERPEMVKAMDQLAAAAPKLAAGLGKLVEFATNHPILAGAGLAGGVAAKGAAGAVIGKVSEGAMEKAGDLLMRNVGASAQWGVAGKLMGASFVGAAAAAGFLIGKAAVDYFLNRDEATLGAIDESSSTAESMAKHGTGTPEQRAEAAARLRKEVEQLDSAEPSFLTGMYDLALAPEGESFGARQGAKLARARDALQALERKPQKPASFFGGDGFNPNNPFGAPIGPPPPPAGGGASSTDAKRIAQEIANGEPRKTVITNEQAIAQAVARQLPSVTLRVQVVGGGNGTNGLPPAPGNGSGSTPR